ncbi:hypothetical protein DUNSADRAFT_3384 [Dunaliella salina]|uniref:Encoded protein n=1 Tax=Dunaliella salina TaxID=3046 RepID=A0ABQ7FVF3_DUNSA|nr:hypothetical protein DUNSADRAFT_3384 [Dunaliella salina]|eukprot:KAF5826370.1 hypothetical protein DUNSADRAFT_3384 [Dunaliella salina]
MELYADIRNRKCLTCIFKNAPSKFTYIQGNMKLVDVQQSPAPPQKYFLERKRLQVIQEKVHACFCLTVFLSF